MQPHLYFPFFKQRRVHLGVCGSVAAFKSLELLRVLRSLQLEVGVTLTPSALEFIRPLSFEALGANPVYTHMFGREDTPFSHLEPAQNAEVLMLAPATANSIAKLASGLADELLACQTLAFSGPVLVAPAMNPGLWSASATQANWQLLAERGFTLIEPGQGEVACGDTGKGRLPSLESIYLHLLKALSPQDLTGKRVLLTYGPTREYWDAVRFWSNPSSGTMGASLAIAAWLRGAQVHVVCGPNNLYLPEQITVDRVDTAMDMFKLCQDYWSWADIGCLTAAVCDFRPQPFGDQKFKKTSTGSSLNITFESNPDILATLGANKKSSQLLLGFAAETDSDLEAAARQKLENKKLDLILANQIGKPASGFAHHTNEVLVLDRRARLERWPVLQKSEVAWRVWDWIQQI
jgi:phosphopantothenoylcysteine decarboxylase/phosphopantothenate--cysteine ligase